MAIPSWTRRSDGAVVVQLPAGTKRGQFEVRTNAGTIVPSVTRESTRRLFGDKLRSGRTTWASGLHHRTRRDVEGVQEWETGGLGRWTDLILMPSIEYTAGWGERTGVIPSNGSRGMAWNTWAFNGVSRGQFGAGKVLGMSIMPHNLGIEHDTPAQQTLHREIQAGKYDWVYEQIAKNLIQFNCAEAIVRIDWEANGPWYKHATHRLAYAADHGKAIAHVAQVMLGVAPKLRFSMDTSSHVSTQYPETAQQWMEAFYPQQYATNGKTVTHLVVSDIYFFLNRNVGDEPTYDQFKAMLWAADSGVTLGKACDFAKSVNVPLGIGEWGLTHKYNQDGSLNNRQGVGDAPAYVEHMHRFITERPEIAYDGYWALADWSVNDLQTDMRVRYPNAWKRYCELWRA